MKFFILFFILLISISCTETDTESTTKKKDCSTIACSDHGKCEMIGDTPRCRCDLSYIETDGECLPILCSVDNPNGKCLVKNHICENGKCIVNIIEDKCNSTNLNGVCPDKFTCENGKCMYNQFCSTSNLTGSCPYYNQICENGTCVLPDCSAEYPNGGCSAGYCNNGSCTMDNMCNSQNPNGNCFAFKRRNMVCNNGECEYTTGSDCWECSEGYTCPPASENSSICEVIGDICSPVNKSGLCPSGFKCEDGACVDLGSSSDLCNEYEGLYSQSYCATSCEKDDDCATYQESCEDTNNEEMGKVCLPNRLGVDENCIGKSCKIGLVCSGINFDLTCKQECSKKEDLCSDSNQICYNIKDDIWTCMSPVESSIGGICDDVYKCPENVLCVEGLCVEKCDADKNCSKNNYMCKNVDGNDLCLLPDFNDSCKFNVQNSCRTKAVCAEVAENTYKCIETCSTEEACIQEDYSCTVYSNSLSICLPPKVGIGEVCDGMIKCEDNAVCAGMDNKYECYEKCDGTSEYDCVVDGYSCDSSKKLCF